MAARIYVPVLVAAIAGNLVPQGQNRAAAGAGTATAIIHGTVVADDASSGPIARAIVTITAPELPISRNAITDDRGEFVVRNLPAGRFTISARKHGYVTTDFGARRIGRSGTPVMLASGQVFDADLRLLPAGVVTGTIRDEHGQPLPGLRIFALDAWQPVAPPPVTASRSSALGVGSETDDLGTYRIFDLIPGEYLIVATPAIPVDADITRPTATEIDRLLAFLHSRSANARGASVETPLTARIAAQELSLAPVYFPGTASLADATRVKVGPAEVRAAIDFVVGAASVTTIDGVILNKSSWSTGSITLSIVPGNALNFFALAGSNPRLTQPPDAEGRFRYANVIPGRYKIVARASATPNSSGGRGGVTVAGVPAGMTTTAGTMYAIEEIEVTGSPVTGVTLALVPGVTASGRVLFAAAQQTAPTDLTSIRVTIQPMDIQSSSGDVTRIGSTFATRQSVMLRADGTFEFPSLAPDSYRIFCDVPASAGSGWWLRSAMVGTRDLLDTSLAVTLGTDVTNIALTLADRHSELGGTLQAPTGAPASDYFIVAMPAEASLRVPGSRRIAATRPGTDGRFRFVDLPRGDYLLSAMNDLEKGDLQRPDVLAEIAAAGVHVALAEGEKKIQDLRIER